MALPRRIFIAIGEPSDVSAVASNDVRLQDLKDATREREKSDKRVKELEDILTKHQKRNQWETTLGGVLLFVLISALLFVIWLCFISQPAQPPPPPPPPEPAPQPTVQPHHDCMRGCGPPYYWEYEGFECWRHRSMRGFCFN